jgi:cation diffusion facilitator CzcD-associated flavoprotein CzcO
MDALVDEALRRADDAETEHFDVLIVGAGISGIGSAYHLKTQCPDRSYVVLEAQDSFGGTWLSHRFPGIRSDSDLYTFGYRFKPWVGPPITVAPEIRKYMGDVVEENDLARHIRYGHKVRSAAWSSEEKLWTITADADGRTQRFTASFLWMCQGYYRHEEGYTPEWPGMDSFEGVIARALARGPRLQGQARRHHRLGRDRGHDGAGDGRDGGQRHGAAALADLLHPPAEHQ